jgi:HSF-type DNA-binding
MKSITHRLTFPHQLHAMLNEAELQGFQDVISWMPLGDAFIIRKPTVFTDRILPTVFRQTKFSSFKRQLNAYGFQRQLTNSLDVWIYSNLPHFRRDSPDACNRIRRRRSDVDIQSSTMDAIGVSKLPPRRNRGGASLLKESYRAGVDGIVTTYGGDRNHPSWNIMEQETFWDSFLQKNFQDRESEKQSEKLTKGPTSPQNEGIDSFDSLLNRELEQYQRWLKSDINQDKEIVGDSEWKQMLQVAQFKSPFMTDSNEVSYERKKTMDDSDPILDEMVSALDQLGEDSVWDDWDPNMEGML